MSLASETFFELVKGLGNIPHTPTHRQLMFNRELRKGTHVHACPRVKVSECKAKIPTHFFERLEQNQKLKSCCRHPENHDIEAFYTSPNWKNKLTPDGYHEPLGGVPDVYIFHCTCGYKHRIFMVGQNDYRPVW